MPNGCLIVCIWSVDIIDELTLTRLSVRNIGVLRNTTYSYIKLCRLSKKETFYAKENQYRTHILLAFKENNSRRLRCGYI